MRQAGTERVYVVVRVDMARRLAEVRPLAGSSRSRATLPFECLRELTGLAVAPSPAP
jgi:hypothetical protein